MLRSMLKIMLRLIYTHEKIIHPSNAAKQQVSFVICELLNTKTDKYEQYDDARNIYKTILGPIRPP